MTHKELEDLKAHLRNPPIGHGHAPIQFDERVLAGVTEGLDHVLIAWHMNAHDVFHPGDLHEVKND